MGHPEGWIFPRYQTPWPRAQQDDPTEVERVIRVMVFPKGRYEWGRPPVLDKSSQYLKRVDHSGMDSAWVLTWALALTCCVSEPVFSSLCVFTKIRG